MAYITNDGARLIERAKTEGKSIVFGAVRMNTIFKSDPSSLVQKSDEWYGEDVGEVVGCLSHVSVDDVSCVCDSKLAVQCNDNSEPWKSIGIYAHLDGEVDELLFACESIQNGEYKDVTIVELPVTLDGVVEDFGLSEGGSGGGGGEGGSTAPLTGSWDNFVGEGSVEDPVDGDRQILENLSVGSGEASIVLTRQESQFNGEEGIWGEGATTFLRITPGGVSLNEYENETGANWSDIINAANSGGGGEGGDIRARQDMVEDDGEGNLMIFGQTITPDSDLIVDSLLFTFDSSGYLKSVCLDGAIGVATIGVIVRDENGEVVTNGRVSGVSIGVETLLTFQSPIQLAAGYIITYQAIISSL